MSAHMYPAELDEILAQCEQEIQDKGRPDLKKWLTQYPQYKDEIIDYCIFSQAFEEAQKMPADPAVEDELHSTALEALQEVRQGPFGGRFQSLLELADSVRLTVNRLAATLELGVSVLVKLDRRLIRPDTVPRPLLERLAELVRQPVERILEYLELPPVVSPNASFRAYEAPGLRYRRSAMRDYLFNEEVDLSVYPSPSEDLEEPAMRPMPEPPLASYQRAYWMVELRRERPGEIERQPFDEAVRSATDMTKKQKAQWLSRG